MSRVVMAVASSAVVAAAAFALWPSSARQPIRATIAVREALAEEREGFARVLAPRPLVFPEDHGPHPDFRTEWWYYTGNLTAAAGRHVGFQLTFFRVALSRTAESRESAWGRGSCTSGTSRSRWIRSVRGRSWRRMGVPGGWRRGMCGSRRWGIGRVRIVG
jgi:hypothetical protein